MCHGWGLLKHEGQEVLWITQIMAPAHTANAQISKKSKAIRNLCAQGQILDQSMSCSPKVLEPHVPIITVDRADC